MYLYSDSGMSEREYASERNKIISELQDIEKRLGEIRSEDQETMISSEDFISRASYFVMVENLIGDAKIDYKKFSQTVDKSIQKSFFTSIIAEIDIVNGKVTSVVFKNAITVRFKYE